MSDERFEQEEPKDETEDVEAHKKKTVMANEEAEVEAHKHRRAAVDEPSSDDESGDDVEAHKHRRAAVDEPASDDESDDVEAHMRRVARHKNL
jgi:hypothetical protein